jgi:hypothetical protein
MSWSRFNRASRTQAPLDLPIISEATPPGPPFSGRALRWLAAPGVRGRLQLRRRSGDSAKDLELFGNRSLNTACTKLKMRAGVSP